jgi:hypothetical protein
MGNKTSYIPKYNKEDYKKQRPGKYTYNIDGENVYWRGNKIQACGSSFVNLHGGYGLEGSILYYRGLKLDIFVKNYLTDGYGSDHTRVFYRGRLTKADPKTFRVFVNGYGRDVDNIYYNGIIYRKRQLPKSLITTPTTTSI